MPLDRGPSPLRPPIRGTTPSHRRFGNLSPVDSDVHPVIHAGRVAVITGAASGIGKAAAIELARVGLKIALADILEDVLAQTAEEVAAIVGDANVLVIPTDVSKIGDVQRLRDKVYEAWGEVAVLLNNAAISPDSKSWELLDNWRSTFEVNLFGVINVQQTFVPSMLYQENQAMVINTGSKQGITNPPGNPAYNATKAAVKSLTEGLAYELRERPACNVTAHLFIPGWTFTGLAARSGGVKPAGAWSAEETALYMLDHVRLGEFYILCPDNEVRRAVDQLRIMWGAGDVAEGRPALSRWHKDWKSLFDEYIRDGLADMQ
ncbi:NAD(P)-binding protein [Boletus coccyginus]|nr:NAD(P)-binding protein [Boletus coccyginus]